MKLKKILSKNTQDSKEFPKNFQRIPKNFQRIPIEFPKKSKKISQDFENITQVNFSITYIALRVRNPFRACFYLNSLKNNFVNNIWFWQFASFTATFVRLYLYCKIPDNFGCWYLTFSKSADYLHFQILLIFNISKVS